MRPDFTKMTVDEIRKLYSEKAGISLEEVQQIKPKSALVEKLMEFYPKLEEVKMSIDTPANIFSQAEIDTVESDIKEQVSNMPERGSETWEDYVIDQLRDHEYILKDGKKYPKATGLRRLVEELLGPIKFSGPINIFPPTNTNGSNATILYKIDIAWHSDMGRIREFIEVADAGPGNTPEEYACHPSATASSRAAGRAYRNALLLSINTAEEMNKVVATTNGPADDIRLLNDNEPITSIQLVGIKNMIDKFNINITNLLSHNGYKDTLESLTKGQAKDLMVQLNKYSSGELSIPDLIKGN